jgi:hypothetical protein
MKWRWMQESNLLYPKVSDLANHRIAVLPIQHLVERKGFDPLNA